MKIHTFWCTCPYTLDLGPMEASSYTVRDAAIKFSRMVADIPEIGRRPTTVALQNAGGDRYTVNMITGGIEVLPGSSISLLVDETYDDTKKYTIVGKFDGYVSNFGSQDHPDLCKIMVRGLRREFPFVRFAILPTEDALKGEWL